jgi:hypothetical protein
MPAAAAAVRLATRSDPDGVRSMRDSGPWIDRRWLPSLPPLAPLLALLPRGPPSQRNAWTGIAATAGVAGGSAQAARVARGGRGGGGGGICDGGSSGGSDVPPPDGRICGCEGVLLRADDTVASSRVGPTGALPPECL